MTLIRIFQGDGSLYEYAGGGMYFAARLDAGEISLAESWQASGVYLFTEKPRERLGDLSIFLEKMLKRLSGCASSRLFLWLAALDDTDKRWHTVALPCKNRDVQAVTDCPCVFGEGEYRLDIPANTRLTCRDDSFGLEAPGDAPITMRLSNAAAVGRDVSLTADGSFCGEAAAEAQDDLFCRMDVAQSYAAAGSRWEKGYAERIKARIFRYTGSLTLSFCFSPLAPYQAEKTWLGLEKSVVLDTGLTAWNGTKLQACTTASSRLVLGKYCRCLYRGAEGMVTKPYLTPDGEYELLPGNGAAGNRLLCGTAGTEFLQLADSRRISFVSGPAFLRGSELTLECTTAWIKPPAEAAYCSQPLDAPFYGKADAAALSFVPAYMARCGEDAPAVPMIGYGGVEQESPVDFERFLYEKRFALLSRSAENDSAGHSAAVTTPQGLMAGISDDIPACWQWIGLANLRDTAAPLPGIRFDWPDSELRTLFQQADMCVLFEKPPQILEHTKIGTDFFFEREGWRFEIEPAKWWIKGKNPVQTALILKYGRNRSLREAFAENEVVGAAIREAYDNLGALREEYKEFIAAVDSRTFQGALFLNIPVTVDRSHRDFIPELGVLLDSIGAGQLYAHHLLLYKSGVADMDGLSMQPTTTGGLIDYRAKEGFSYRKDGSPRPYGFCSTALCVTIKDGSLQDIRSESEVLLNRFFGSPAVKVNGSAGNSLTVTGRLQLRDGIREYLYELKEGGGFTLTGSAVESIYIDKLTLSAGEKNAFRFGGVLSFTCAGDADLFSYGVQAGQPPEQGVGLRFEGLELTGCHEEWEMNYREIMLRPLDSVPRSDSLVSGLPVTPVSLARYTGSAEELGYASVTAPLRQGKLEEEWYGLIFELPLGALGGLAPDGPLTLTLLFGWSPGANGNAPPLFAGAKRWQSPLNLQGVFTIGFHSIAITVQKQEAGSRYQIVLNQFGLHVLGTTFPPGANKLVLFGNGQGQKLGWYAAYKGEVEPDGGLD